MEDVLKRLEEIENILSRVHFKRIFDVSTKVALARMATAEEAHVNRLERILQMSKDQMNETKLTLFHVFVV